MNSYAKLVTSLEETLLIMKSSMWPKSRLQREQSQECGERHAELN